MTPHTLDYQRRARSISQDPQTQRRGQDERNSPAPAPHRQQAAQVPGLLAGIFMWHRRVYVGSCFAVMSSCVSHAYMHLCKRHALV